MATETYSVKANEETQERIKNLISESGMNGKDFFVNLLSVYELQKAKEVAPILAADIEELETLTRRMNAIFTNTSERMRTMQTEAAEELERQAATDKGTIVLLQQRIHDLEKECSQDEDSIKEYIKDTETAREQIADLQNQLKLSLQTNADKQALMDEYRSKHEALTASLDSCKAAMEENQKLKSENGSLVKRVEELESQITAFGSQHAKDLEQIKAALNLEHEKAVLEINIRHQREIQEQQNSKWQALFERLENASMLPIPDALPTTPPIVSTPNRAKKTSAKKKTATEA